MKKVQLDSGNQFLPKDAWDSLSLAEKAEMMKVAVRNGMYDLQTIRKKYNEYAMGGETVEEESTVDLTPIDLSTMYANNKLYGNRFIDTTILRKLDNYMLKNKVGLPQRQAIAYTVQQEGNTTGSHGNGAYGFVGWRGERAKNLPATVEGQARKLYDEVYGKFNADNWNHGGKGSGYNSGREAQKAFQNAKTVEEATKAFNYGYVRPPLEDRVNRTKTSGKIFKKKALGGNLFEDGGFTSELDWSPESWFSKRVAKPDGSLYNDEEATRLASHVPEYHNIEQTSKADGTWLKMSDGSTWEGDPRSWVMMQSEAFKKNYASKPWYTGQAEWPTTFDYPNDSQGAIETNKMTRAPYYNGQMWFSDDKSYGDAFAYLYGSDGNSYRRKRPEEQNIWGHNFLAAIPKKGTYRNLASPRNGTYDNWRSMPYYQKDGHIYRLSRPLMDTKRTVSGYLNVRKDSKEVLTDDVVNWSKDLGDSGIFLHKVGDGQGIKISNPDIMHKYNSNQPVKTVDFKFTHPILEEFISQPGFTDKVKFIEGNTGDFDIDNPYKYADNLIEKDDFLDHNYAALGGNLLKSGGDLGYNLWKKKIRDYKHIDVDNDNTYDYEGFYYSNPQNAWALLNDSPDAHFTDKFKTVYHPTFSNQSIYSGKYHPIYNPQALNGGTWNREGNVFTMSPDGYTGPVSMDERQWYLIDSEPYGVQLRESDGSLPVYDGISWGGVLPEITVTGKKHSLGGPFVEAALNEYKNGGSIHIKPENRGKFTRLKERTGHSASWFKEHGTPAQKKMATFALNSRHWKHGDGGPLIEAANIYDGTTEDSQQMNGWSVSYNSTPISSTPAYAPNGRYGINGKPYEEWAKEVQAEHGAAVAAAKQPAIGPVTMSDRERAIIREKAERNAEYAKKQELQEKGVEALMTLATIARPSTWAALPFTGIEHFGEGFGTEWVNTPIDLAFPAAWKGAVNTTGRVGRAVEKSIGKLAANAELYSATRNPIVSEGYSLTTLPKPKSLYRANVYRGGKIRNPYNISLTTDPKYAEQYGEVTPYLFESSAVAEAEKPLMGYRDPVNNDMFIYRNIKDTPDANAIVGHDLVTGEFPHTSEGTEIISLSPNNIYPKTQEPSTISWEGATAPKITAENTASITPEQWNAAYRAAYERGDVAEGQRLWGLWFKQKAPNAVSTTGKEIPQTLYHTGRDNILAFRTPESSAKISFDEPYRNISWAEKEGYNISPEELAKYNNGETAIVHKPTGVYLSDDLVTSKTYLGKEPDVNTTYPLFVNLENPLISVGKGEQLYSDASSVRQLQKAIAGGNDGVFLKDVKDYGPNDAERVVNGAWQDSPSTTVVVFDPRRMKSAEPFTLDDNGNLIDLTKRADFSNPDIRYARDPSSYQAPYVSNGRQGLSTIDFTDFDTMVERMNSAVEYSGKIPFKDGKMTGFRKWALDNGASPTDIVRVEKEFSGNNWSKLRREFSLTKDSERHSAYIPATDKVVMNLGESDFNQVFPHEVEHRLFYKLFGDNRSSVSTKDISDAFAPNSPITKAIDEFGEPYYYKNNYEELLNRLTQIKNALGIKEARALTAKELKEAYRLFKNGSTKFADNLSDFFDSIKSWKAAAKLSGKSLTTAGIGHSVLNSEE